MKQTGLFVLLLMAMLAIIPARAQNLVLNPSFEDYNSCPTGLSGFAFTPTYIDFPTADHWVSPVKQASPDYFNGCAQALTGVSTPNNTFGYQQARTGNGYAGIIAWESEYKNGNLVLDFSEYIQTKLAQPLQAGERYCVTYYVSPSVSSKQQYNFIGIDEVGVNFAHSQYSEPAGYLMNMSYDIVTPAGMFLQDTSAWIKVQEIYTARGGEEWLTLGRFGDGVRTPNFQPIYPAVPDPNLNNRCYLYIDDVSVIKLAKSDTTFTVQDSSYCVKSMLPMTLASSGYDGTYIWNNGATSKKISINKDGVYWCRSYSNCHVYIDTFIVKHVDPKKLDIGTKIVNCMDEDVTLTSNVNFNTYAWSTGASTKSITVNQTGVYKVTGTNECGTQTDSVRVYIQPPTPTPETRDTTVCQFSQPILTNIKGDNIKWYANPAGVVGAPQQPGLITVEPGYYNLYVTQTIGECESAKKTIRINVTYTPHEELEDDEVMCGNKVRLIGKDLGSNMLYKWNTGDIKCCIRPDRAGAYKVAIRNECGVYIDTVRVEFSACEECVTVPNAFTPNNDGTNDRFEAFVTCPISEFSMKIFNRWGEKLYETNDVNRGWNGTNEGVYVENGVYIYMIEYRAKSTKRGQFIRGNVTVIR